MEPLAMLHEFPYTPPVRSAVLNARTSTGVNTVLRLGLKKMFEFT